jgi:hypothetical protein
MKCLDNFSSNILVQYNDFQLLKPFWQTTFSTYISCEFRLLSKRPTLFYYRSAQYFWQERCILVQRKILIPLIAGVLSVKTAIVAVLHTSICECSELYLQGIQPLYSTKFLIYLSRFAVTCYLLNRRGTESRWGARFSVVQNGPGAHTASSTMGNVSLSRCCNLRAPGGKGIVDVVPGGTELQP